LGRFFHCKGKCGNGLWRIAQCLKNSCTISALCVMAGLVRTLAAIAISA
jgi:hypothetical protein